MGTEPAIYTGCFFHHYPGAIKVSIARSHPSRVDCMSSATFLAPSPSLLRAWKDGMLTEESYAARYRYETLSALNKEEVVRYVGGLAREYGADAVVLCCWEKPGKFCHRHLVAEWMGIEEAVASNLKARGER